MNNDVDVQLFVAEPDDSAALLNLLKKLQRESDLFELDVDLSSITVEQEAQQIKMIMGSKTNVILLAATQNELIGLGTVEQLDDTTNGELGVAVLANYQNIGLGTLLVNELIAWQTSYSSLTGLCLEVKKENVKAIHIYEKLGFKIQSETTQTIWMQKKRDD